MRYSEHERSFNGKRTVTQAYIDEAKGPHGYAKVERQTVEPIDDKHWKVNGEKFEGPMDEYGGIVYDAGMDEPGRII